MYILSLQYKNTTRMTTNSKYDIYSTNNSYIIEESDITYLKSRPRLKILLLIYYLTSKRFQVKTNINAKMLRFVRSHILIRKTK